MQGPALEEHRKEIAGKTGEELMEMAGPTTRSIDARLFAAYRLETLVTDNKNRIELYRLALNDVLDGSGQYRDAIYPAIYRAELAKARAQEVGARLTFFQLVKNRHRTHRNELPSGPHLGT